MPLVGYIVAALLAGAVGAAELISRYRDRPSELLRMLPVWLYVGINAAAATAALYVTRAMGWDFGASNDNVEFVRVLVAGFASLAFFRSSLFTVRLGDKDVGIGPSTLLTLALDAADRGVNRTQGMLRAKTVERLMKGVSFEKAKVALPTYCFNLMEGVPADEQRRVVEEIEGLERSNRLSPQMKSYNLGLVVLRVTGETVLAAAVAALADELASN